MARKKGRRMDSGRDTPMNPAAPSAQNSDRGPEPPSTPAARALAEAAQREKKRLAASSVQPKEHSGRGGLDPVRYGDWEVKGLTSDF
jgi:hypothetical protein